MTFQAFETGPLSQPVEFLTIKNGSNIWQYTNSNINQTLGARTFVPAAYTRNEPSFSKDTSDGQIKIRIPSSLPIVEFYETIPSSEISSITIERQIRNDPDLGVQIFWKGQVASVQREGDFATILAVPLNRLPAQIPRYTYSGLCNWFLFQDQCGLSRENWRHIGPVVTLDPSSPTIITITGLRTQAAALDAQVSPQTLTSQQLDDYWLGGYIQNADGEKRGIYATDVDGVPDRIRVLQPFRSLAVSDVVNVFAGCDRTRDTCAAKFNNSINHGGFPDIPVVNPFTTELPPGSAATEKKVWFGN